MQTINGKLIAQEQNQLNTLKQQTQSVIQRCQHLESQITTISQQQNTQHSHEINAVKNYVNKLDKKLNYLEQTVAKQFTKFVLINICGAIGLIVLWFWLGNNTQPTYQKNKAQHTQSIELKHHSIY